MGPSCEGRKVWLGCFCHRPHLFQENGKRVESPMQRSLMVCALVACVCSPFGAMAAPVDLASNAYVTERLVAARTGDVLRKACPSASVRWLKVWNEVESLKSWARDRGHTHASVSAFLDDRVQKDRIYGLADAQMRAAGYTGDAQSACAVARAEVAKGSLAGSLLKVR